MAFTRNHTEDEDNADTDDETKNKWLPNRFYFPWLIMQYAHVKINPLRPIVCQIL